MKTITLLTPLLFLPTFLSGCGSGGSSSDAGLADGDGGAADAGEDSAPADADRGTPDGADTGPDGADGGVDPDADTTAEAGPADLAAGLLYMNQRVFREDDFFARGGTARLEIHDPQELPVDDRPEIFNGDGERCTFETGTEWPLVLSDGETWPAGPFYDGGDLTLTVSGAPGPVVYEYFDSYYLRQSPGPVVLGSMTHNSFFPPEHIPHGAAASFSAAGGTHVGAFSFDGVRLATDYTVSAPDMVEGGDVIDTASALTFSWSPAAPGDTMAVIVKDSFSFIKCVFDDDGEATVPAEAMGLLIGGPFVTLTVQTWREHTEALRVTDIDGTAIDVELSSRHVQIGRFASE